MSSKGRFDLVVVGAGPGGYVGAIRAAQLGMRVAIIEEDRPGGVCLNWGCIPTKALLSGAELVEDLTRHGETFGITTAGLVLDYGKLIDHSRKTADRLCKGVQGLFKKNQIELIPGRGRLAGPNSVSVNGEVLVEGDQVMLATGSSEWVPPGLEVDGERVLTSREALESRQVPARLVVIGAGAVGIEFAYVYAMYGSQVTIVEMADQMLPGADPEVAAALQREFRRKQIDVRLGTRYEELKQAGAGVTLTVSKEGQSEELVCDQVLAAIGRRPRSQDLGLDEAGVQVDDKGFVRVDDTLRSSVASISAIGDLAGGPLLAHKASEEGIAAVEFVGGVDRGPLDHAAIPACIYCQPQVAWVGLTEAQAREKYGDAKVGKFPFTASGKAIAGQHTAGFVKVVADPEYGQIVGAHLVGHGATELLPEMGLALTLEATTREIIATTHAHPTLSEALLEATLAAEGRALNF
ncbi:MAG: dihydrolipoyl dehydrogenase [Deltaproteobacteria bacterium]|nr:dihydrolipoyl dehydrogenase [Deltaproteobacteria bacterium]